MSGVATYEAEAQSVLPPPHVNRAVTQAVDTDTKTQPKSIWGTALSRPQTPIILYLEHAGLEVPVCLTERMILGRQCEGELAMVDLDFTAYDGAAKGVSRVHATLYRVKNVVYLMDMDSSNGTFLNGRRMPPYQERIVRDGDEVCLGRLKFFVYL